MFPNLENQGGQGFGTATQADVDALNKALSAGHEVNPLELQGGGAFRVESLENSLKVLTYGDQHIKFWKKIPKQTAYSTVEQYGQLLDYGRNQGAFVGEGMLPDTNDSTYARKAAFVKFLGTTREVTHPMTLVNSAFGNVVARQNQDGILWMLKQVEQSLFWGNSKLKPGGEEGREWDGLVNLIDKENTIDLKGNYLEEHHMNWGAQMIIQNYGTPTDMFLPFEVMAQFSQEFFPKERVLMPTQQGYQAGVVVNKFMTHGGEVEFSPDIFLTKTKPLSMNASSYKAPATGTLAAVIDASGTTGDFAKQGGGTYKYAITLNNDHGESIPSNVVSVTLTGADLAKGVKLTITNPASTAFPVDYIRVYRSEKDGNQLYEVDKFAVTSQGSAATTVRTDNGETIANTYTSFMGEMSPEIIGFKQLAPMMKMDLATLGPVIRWMILMYGVPVLYAPKKWMKYTNIKADVPGFIGA
ncbi:major capsid protein [Bacillus phage Shanette]|uniref:Major capsid protein n=2 Tax=Siminovitchvirus TaxID=1918721 RepID=S5MAG9_9CAUD|nr:major head protein [Bacillus phage JL]YP_009216089.1 major head protein [Bacillus phage Shanette]AGR46769.1 major capsid protein [Bacillus phage JL]AGR46988.1 major capsid protein [Bacillus phage Shanette]